MHSPAPRSRGARTNFAEIHPHALATVPGDTVEFRRDKAYALARATVSGGAEARIASTICCSMATTSS